MNIKYLTSILHYEFLTVFPLKFYIMMNLFQIYQLICFVQNVGKFHFSFQHLNNFFFFQFTIFVHFYTFFFLFFFLISMDLICTKETFEDIKVQFLMLVFIMF